VPGNRPPCSGSPPAKATFVDIHELQPAGKRRNERRRVPARPATAPRGNYCGAENAMTTARRPGAGTCCSAGPQARRLRPGKLLNQHLSASRPGPRRPPGLASQLVYGVLPPAAPRSTRCSRPFIAKPLGPDKDNVREVLGALGVCCSWCFLDNIPIHAAHPFDRGADRHAEDCAGFVKRRPAQRRRPADQ